MDEIVTALREEQLALAELVGTLDDEGLARPSRCPGWNVADVLLHLAQTNELAVASATDRFGEAVAAAPEVGDVPDVDAWADAVVDAERSADLSAIRTRWLASAEAQEAAFADTDPGERLPWVAGELAARSLATTRLSETWIHANDIAWGLGVEHPATGRLWHVARLAHRTLPYAFTRAGRHLSGPVAFVLEAPSGEEWVFGEADAPTVVRGTAVELCEVAGQRRAAAETSLVAEGPDAAGVLEVVRTFA